MSFEDTKVGAIAETGVVVAPLEVTDRPKKPVDDRLQFERLYDGVGRVKGLRVRPRAGTLIEYVDLVDLDHRKKCRAHIHTAPARGRPRKFPGRD